MGGRAQRDACFSGSFELQFVLEEGQPWTVKQRESRGPIPWLAPIKAEDLDVARGGDAEDRDVLTAVAVDVGVDLDLKGAALGDAELPQASAIKPNRAKLRDALDLVHTAVRPHEAAA